MFHVITQHQRHVPGCKRDSKPPCWYYYCIIYIQLIMMDHGSRTADECPTGKCIVVVLLLYYIHSIYAWIMEHVKMRISVLYCIFCSAINPTHSYN